MQPRAASLINARGAPPPLALARGLGFASLPSGPSLGPQALPRVRAANDQRGFSLAELLVSMAITTIIMGATMAALRDAVKAADTATLLTGMNGGLRTAMDLMVRDLLQVGQGLPAGRLVFVPSGGNEALIRLPGPPTTNYTFPAGTTEITAVVPGPGLGPVVNGTATDMITTIAVDSSFDGVRLTALAADGQSMTVVNTVDIDDGGPDDLRPGDLVMLSKGATSTIVQITNVNGQQAFFNPGDSMNLNQNVPPNGTVLDLRNTAPADVLPAAPAPQVIPTTASKIRMITYYIDATDPLHPRLVRRINNGHPTNFDNTLGTAVALDIENLSITYDLADGVGNPANVRMEAVDLTVNGACNPDPCSPNQIRKVNILLAGRSRIPMRGTNQYFRNTLVTQVSLRSLAFVDRYR
jgi:prepilin-type N-terminal cleavage/methylation domain-containing protein